MTHTPTRTYQTRLRLDENDAKVLDAYAELFGRMERSLFAALQSEALPVKDIKRAFLPRFKVTARQFNAAHAHVRGKIAGIKEGRVEQLATLKRRLKEAKKTLKKVDTPHKRHQKKRRLYNLQKRHEHTERDHKAGRVRLCYGSGKLFRAQFSREETGFASHDAWRRAWRDARKRQFLVLGSKDETAGCQSCVAAVRPDGAIDLRLRLPDGIEAGRYLKLTGLRFAHGHENIVRALGLNQSQDRCNGVALSYRFVRDDRSWRVFVSVELPRPKRVSVFGQGVLGIDLNVDHLAVTEADRFGNPIASRRIPCDTRYRSQNQRKAIVGDAVKQVIQWAVFVRKPIVIERLDFRAKKAQAEDKGKRYNRMLSGFAYAQAQMLIRARAFDAGIKLLEVNPAYTSVMGRIKFKKRYGLSVHSAAALCIGRRGMGCCEKLPSQLRGTLPLSARNRGRHVWSQWAAVSRMLKRRSQRQESGP